MAPPARARGPGPGDRFQKAKQSSKLLMFYGSGAMILLIIALLLVKAPWAESERPPPPPVQHDDLKLQAVNDLARKAMLRYNDACKLSGPDKARMIREAMDLNGQALEKARELSEDPRYKGDEYNGVFEPVFNKLQQEHSIMGLEYAKTPHG